MLSRWMFGLSLAAGPGLLAQITFVDQVYPIFEAAQCRGCHASDGVASVTRIRFPETGADRERIEAFGITLVDVVDRTNPEQSPLAGKPTNRIRHTGGERIKQGSPEEKVLLDWVRHLATLKPEAIAAARAKIGADNAKSAPDQHLRRLTHSQYNNTVRDLLGDHGRPADRFPPEDFVHGFKNQLRTQAIPPMLAEVYSGAAEKLALNAFRSGDVRGLIPCKPAGAADTRCRDQFVKQFGLRAFRRPLTDAETRRYTALFAAQAAKTGKFLEGARVLVETMIQSPKFLFHHEAGPGGLFADYEVASRLSFLIWDTMPDQALFDAAARGELRTPEGRERATRRLLDHPQAKLALDEFFAQWLRFDRVLNSVKDRRRYPQFTPELAATMIEETGRLLGQLVWEDGNFMEAFTANYSFLNTELAQLYGVPAPRADFDKVIFPADARRSGLLGHASILTATAGPVETSPTARGIFVREQLLCQHVPNPPPGVNTNLPEVSADLPLTMRQRLRAHVENASCAGCHRLMDPIGFGLENYDAIGRWRQKELIEFRGANRNEAARKVELDLDPSGEIAGISDSAFNDPRRLGQVLAASQACQECIVKQVFRYGFGRLETPADEAAIQAGFRRFKESGFRFKELFLALVRTPQFLEGLEGAGSQSTIKTARR